MKLATAVITIGIVLSAYVLGERVGKMKAYKHCKVLLNQEEKR